MKIPDNIHVENAIGFEKGKVYVINITCDEDYVTKNALYTYVTNIKQAFKDFGIDVIINCTNYVNLSAADIDPTAKSKSNEIKW